MTYLVPVISDLQVPLQDQGAVDAVATFLADKNLSAVCVGDVLDSWQVSRWCKGLAGEYDGKLAEARDQAVKVMRSLRISDLSRSNHDDRIETYVRKYAPALSSLPELTIENFLRLPDINVNFHRTPVEVAPGWVMVHGDEGSLIPTPGGTALNIAKKFGCSVVCGHTHKMGLQHQHFSYNGKTTREVFGFEVGNLMDASQAKYLKAGHSNWTQGFGVLIVDGLEVTPVPVIIRNGSFWFDGKKWSA